MQLVRGNWWLKEHPNAARWAHGGQEAGRTAVLHLCALTQLLPDAPLEFSAAANAGPATLA
eukprot:867030-Lingulodinium_polyedra.AAC.1